MKSAALFIATVAAEQPSFREWAVQYGFNGDDSDMEAKYNANVEQIEAWNADPEETATFGVNKFSGMTYEEFAATYLGTMPMQESDLPNLGVVEESEVTLSDVDWNVTPVKNQGSCGSCWAFGTMGSIEHIHKLNTASTVSLAEQQLVDCDKRSSGCNGGRPDWAMNYLANGPIYTTSSYPYTARDGSCKSGSASGVQIGGYKTVPKSDSGLASALGSSAVTVMVYADSKFQSYTSGVLSGVSTTCSLNHAVLATGYGSNFWKIKNSWGTSWGEAGYIRFQRTTSGCGPFGLFYDSPVVPTGVSAAVEV